MKKLLYSLVFSALAAAQAQSPYASISEQFWGPKTVFAGYSNWYMFLPRMVVPITCDPSTYFCTATGYQFQGNETVNFESTGTPPSGVYALWDTVFPVYGICELQGSSFRLHQSDCSGPLQTFTDAGTGSQSLLISTQNIFQT